MSNHDGGPAFPVAENHCIADDFEWTAGMSLRDYFAAKAMQAIAGAIATEDEYGIIHNVPNDVAGIAYTYADAMLDRREE